MLGNRSAHLYNGSSDGGRSARQRSITQDSLPAVYLKDRNDICQSSGPHASFRSLVGQRTFSGNYGDEQGLIIDEVKELKEYEDPSIGRYRRVRENSNHDSVIVLLDDPPRNIDFGPHIAFGTATPNTSSSSAISPRIEGEFDDTRSHHGSDVSPADHVKMVVLY
jgi:hypothetical protein